MPIALGHFTTTLFILVFNVVVSSFVILPCEVFVPSRVILAFFDWGRARVSTFRFYYLFCYDGVFRLLYGVVGSVLTLLCIDRLAASRARYRLGLVSLKGRLLDVIRFNVRIVHVGIQ